MEPDYLRYANELIDRLKKRKPAGPQLPNQPAQIIIINAPQGSSFYINGGQPSQPPSEPGGDAATGR